MEARVEACVNHRPSSVSITYWGKPKHYSSASRDLCYLVLDNESRFIHTLTSTHRPFSEHIGYFHCSLLFAHAIFISLNGLPSCSSPPTKVLLILRYLTYHLLHEAPRISLRIFSPPLISDFRNSFFLTYNKLCISLPLDYKHVEVMEHSSL